MDHPDAEVVREHLDRQIRARRPQHHDRLPDLAAPWSSTGIARVRRCRLRGRRITIVNQDDAVAGEVVERMLDVAQRLLEAMVAVDENDVELLRWGERCEEFVARRLLQAATNQGVGMEQPLQRRHSVDRVDTGLSRCPNVQEDDTGVDADLEIARSRSAAKLARDDRDASRVLAARESSHDRP